MRQRTPTTRCYAATGPHHANKPRPPRGSRGPHAYPVARDVVTMVPVEPDCTWTVIAVPASELK